MAIRPSPAFLWRHPAHWLALGFGSGLSPKAPGTVGTLWGWLAWWPLSMTLSSSTQGLFIAVAALVGWWACKVTAEHLQMTDPGAIVWDEIVAIWLLLWLLGPAPLWMQLLTFALFRFFDAAKPGPVAWADQRFKGDGWRGAFGIMFDDLVAAACTLPFLVLIQWLRT
ncbi:MAG: Phosphatidylglycerophosphatase [Pseudomonadota bacterium]|jgi:phosphatidylglycerophosphatase A